MTRSLVSGIWIVLIVAVVISLGSVALHVAAEAFPRHGDPVSYHYYYPGI